MHNSGKDEQICGGMCFCEQESTFSVKAAINVFILMVPQDSLLVLLQKTNMDTPLEFVLLMLLGKKPKNANEVYAVWAPSSWNVTLMEMLQNEIALQQLQGKWALENMTCIYCCVWIVFVNGSSGENPRDQQSVMLIPVN